MNNRYEWNTLLKLGAVAIGSIVTLMSMYLSFVVTFSGTIPSKEFVGLHQSWPWIILGFIVINLLFGTYIFYNKSKTDILYFTLLSQIVLSVYVMALSYVANWETISRSVVLWNVAIGTVVMFCYNTAVYWLYHRLRGQKKILVVGQPDRVLEAVHNFECMGNKRHTVTHVILNNYYHNVKKWSKAVDIVYLTGYIEESERLKIYEFLMKQNKKLFISTEFENLMMVNPNIMSFEDESIIEVSPFKISAEDALIKRLVDIMVALVLIVITLPIMLVTMVAIKLDSPGPIFYKQERVTIGHRTFNILKFRSMSATAEKDTGPVLAASNDSRVTRVGKVIRSLRIDELPQLFNVLLGDMSLVGPRPERPFFVSQFQEQNPYYALRHHVRAGITGYAQVYGKYSTDFNNKLNFDLLYIKNYSLAFDLKLLFQTVKILFDKVSSRGVEETVLEEAKWQDYRDKMLIIE
ncbi:MULTISPECIES: sugar transferase [unclassified Facklamia]|uniref:sugar transferase n=1 Tax=Aerococcaceae TaxID=186827 RepID=UPI0013B933D0|nr:exopolysaccharide biosynthesis polyprenyl glycosylphosphotransferase [Facklamia sp. 252]NEW67724.1 exopolysaccharide biosynthesis polyprenyl glycosylphosphotransferase [Facklamia sp. 253]QQD65701.1 sugar transferase [Aerococcaceae bacterium zg-252]